MSAIDFPKPYLKKTLNKLYREAGLMPRQVSLLRDCFRCAANLYGMLSVEDLYNVLKCHLGLSVRNAITKALFFAFAEIAIHEDDNFIIMGLKGLEGKKDTTPLEKKVFFHVEYFIMGDWDKFDDVLFGGKRYPFYLPDTNDFLNYKEDTYYERNLPTISLVQFLQANMTLSGEQIRELVSTLIWDFRISDMRLQDVMDMFVEWGVDISAIDQDRLLQLIADVHNNARKHVLRGHTPCECRAFTSPQSLRL